MRSPRTKPVVAIVGAGRVGRALSRRLRQRGWRISAVVARSLASARAATRAIGAGRPCIRTSRDVLAADIVLLATPDRAIAEVARDLARLGGSSWRGKIVLHTCGALDHSVLRPLRRRGAATGSLHPLQTFSGHGFPRLEGCVCAIEGTAAAARAARRISAELGCIPVRVSLGAKPAYHAAAALAAGHVLGVIETAVRILVTTGFSRRQAVRALLPLTRQTLLNFERAGGPRSWTGPASRGDWETVARHQAALQRFPREYRAAYALLARLSVLVLTRRPGTMRRLVSVPRGT